MNTGQQNLVEAHLCQVCKGSGKLTSGSLFSKNDDCSNCRGSGYIGKDNNYEYYLEKDTQGNLRVMDVKASTYDSISTEKSSKSERRSILRWILFILFIMSYTLYLILHFTYLKDIEILRVVTILFIGSIILLILFSTNLFTKLVEKIKEKIFDEPKDYIWASNRKRH